MWRLFRGDKMKEECETCGEELTNPQFILEKLTSIGYVPVKFCNKKCFVGWVVKRFKRQIKKKNKMDKCYVCKKRILLGGIRISIKLPKKEKIIYVHKRCVGNLSISLEDLK